MRGGRGGGRRTAAVYKRVNSVISRVVFGRGEKRANFNNDKRVYDIIYTRTGGGEGVWRA